jgi:hypothetical protein
MSKDKEEQKEKEVTFITDKKDTDAIAIWLDIDKIMVGGAVGNAIKELQENQKLLAKAIDNIMKECSYGNIDISLIKTFSWFKENQEILKEIIGDVNVKKDKE